MIFLSLIVVLLLVQWWGSGAPLQYDEWFFRWLKMLQSWRLVRSLPGIDLLLAVGVPAAILGLAVWFVDNHFSSNWLFFIYVPILLYSLGRGNFSAEVKAYLAASERGNNVLAARLIDDLGHGTEFPDDREVNNWSKLHDQMLHVISYRGFERMFAVLFWFLICGAVGALIYRLSVIYQERATKTTTGNRLAIKWLWLLEWPAVRVMALTWAMVGNFETCYHCWQNRLLDVKSSSMTQLYAGMRGALGLDDAKVAGESPMHVETPVSTTPTYSLALVKASLALFSRSLLLWVSVIALATILF